MKFGNKRRARIIRDYCIGWTIAFLFLCIVRGEGTLEKGSVQFEFWTSIFVSLIFGPAFGSVSGFAQILTEERVYKRMSIHKLILLRLTYALLFLTTLIVVAYVMVTTFFGVTIGLMEFAFEPGSFAIYFYILSVDLFMVVLRQINLMLGDGNLTKMMRGKFYTPREEQRIFMFLDLQSSTQLAEKLGHIEYSRLIQDCFNDLGVVAEYDAEIYQYVGDEVILTWNLKDGLKNGNCLRTFFAFKKQFSDRKKYYEEKYGTVPFFKAGLNAGIVTVTEVGKYKKEIAYHGDTINTAARIQGKCNELGQEILISGYLKKELDTTAYDFEPKGSMTLRGKEDEVTIYAVTPL